MAPTLTHGGKGDNNDQRGKWELGTLISQEGLRLLFHAQQSYSSLWKWDPAVTSTARKSKLLRSTAEGRTSILLQGRLF